MSLLIKSLKNELIVKLLIVGFGITFIMNPEIKDPINSPKFWLLLFGAIWLVPDLLKKRPNWVYNKETSFFKNIVMLFVIALFFSAISTENIYRAFLGEAQRRNGFLSYACLAVVALVATRVNLVRNFSNYVMLLFYGTLILSIYGLFQSFGVDFVSWNNQYSPVIGTLGNPNFMGAALSILSMLILPAIYSQNFNCKLRISFFAFLGLNLYVIYKTNASQGILTFIFGISFFSVMWLFTKNKKIALLASIGFFILLAISILGIFQEGPFKNYLYKSSVSIRGYYWDAGIKMFLNNPLTGVGLDSYGLYFNQFRDLGYPLKYGFYVTSNNAHNVFIQLFATGGLFVGLLYTIMILFISIVAFKKIFQSSGEQKLFIFSLLTCFLVIQLQSLVSIDNIGIGIWNWVVAGLIVGYGNEVNAKEHFQKSNNKLKQKNEVNFLFLIHKLGLICTLVFIIILYQGEKKAYDLESLFYGTSGSVSPEIINYTLKNINTTLMEPYYKLNIAETMAERGYLNEAINITTDLLKSDSQNINYLNARASMFESRGNIELAIRDRIEISKLNPYNAFNYKLIAEMYIREDLEFEARKVLNNINSFAPNSDISKELELKISMLGKKIE